MEVKHMTCVVCPRGCPLTVGLEDGKIVSVTGNTCKRGLAYAQAEIEHPERMLTTTVRVEGRRWMLPVRTRTAIPKEQLFAAMEMLKQTSVQAPVRVGDVIVPDLCGTGVAVIAARSMA